jgi:xylan 1,4-beta-xylosidase
MIHPTPSADPAAPTLTPDWLSPGEPFRHTWRTLGNIDQFRWLPRADVQAHLAMARDELGVRHVRAAAMYGPEMRIVGRPLTRWDQPDTGETQHAPNWQLVDITIEQLLALGLKPIYTTSFTPPGFSDSTATCWPDRNPIGMPRDLDAWSDFVTDGLRHHVRRFGLAEMRTWYFECWNEPNLSGFFDGSREDFFRLWAATWRAVKGVDPAFRFGGPSTARGEWIGEFLDWTRQNAVPPDYIITHVYNNDSDAAPLSPFDGPASHRVKDSPHFASGVVRGVRAELDQRGWQGEVHWNEWGRSWFPHDPKRESGLEAAFIVKTMSEVSQDADQFAFWCLSDIYDQIGFQSSEFQGHYGLLSLHGLRKPAWFAHVLLNGLGTERLKVAGTDPLLGAIATRDGSRASVLLFAYPETVGAPAESAPVRLALPSGVRDIRVCHVDAQRNNIIHRWKELGAPDAPERQTLDSLRTANTLDWSPASPDPSGLIHLLLERPGIARVDFSLPG